MLFWCEVLFIHSFHPNFSGNLQKHCWNYMFHEVCKRYVNSMAIQHESWVSAGHFWVIQLFGYSLNDLIKQLLVPLVVLLHSPDSAFPQSIFSHYGVHRIISADAKFHVDWWKFAQRRHKDTAKSDTSTRQKQMKSKRSLVIGIIRLVPAWKKRGELGYLFFFIVEWIRYGVTAFARANVAITFWRAS